MIVGCAFALAGCFGGNSSIMDGGAIINDRVKFTSASYGVAASPRVSRSRKVRKGGGRRQIGKPYKIRGKWYTPREQPGYDRVGSASWYGPNFHGRLTANGEVYDQFALTAAHPTFPLPSYARVTNLANGHSVVVRVNDRGPYHSGRIIDLSARASELLDYQQQGTARVRVQYIGQAPLHGLDEKYLAASFSRDGGSTAFAYAKTTDDAISDVDEFSTGTIRPGAGKKVFNDPFLREINALKNKKDTGSTLAMRKVFANEGR